MTAAIPQTIQTYCQQSAVDLTLIRTTLLNYLWHSRKPVKAYAMIDVLREKGIGAAKPATVYRTLKYLTDFGLVHKVHALNAYIPCQHPGKHANCQLVICDQCQTAQEFCDRTLEQAIPAKTKALGFRPTRSVVEVYGLCKGCSR